MRPATWANGTDIGTGAARDNDLAVIASHKNAQGQFVGDITGYYGVRMEQLFIRDLAKDRQSSARSRSLDPPAIHS